MTDLSVKKYRAPVLRARECAIATAQAETAAIAPRCLAALPHRWSRRSVVSLEAQRSAAAALAYPSSLTPCLPPLSAFSPMESKGSHRRETLLRVRRGTSRYRTIGKWYLSGHQSNCTPRGQSSRTGPLKRAQPEHRRALIPERSSSLIRDDLWSKANPVRQSQAASAAALSATAAKRSASRANSRQRSRDSRRSSMHA